ncbi:MAG: hypothetical protein GY896_14360, partial [Gammaproteobacteria bacterium]|nr:hypothetical protein [Gammaproteobacteria bacterium]
DASRQCEGIDELPHENSCDKGEWELLIECLEGAVLWDTDFEDQDRLDVDPDASRALDQFLGISDNYYTEVPHDPPDDQINLYIDALMGLTPRGRGESYTDDEEAGPSNDSPF